MREARWPHEARIVGPCVVRAEHDHQRPGGIGLTPRPKSLDAGRRIRRATAPISQSRIQRDICRSERLQQQQKHVVEEVGLASLRTRPFIGAFPHASVRPGFGGYGGRWSGFAPPLFGYHLVKYTALLRAANGNARDRYRRKARKRIS